MSIDKKNQEKEYRWHLQIGHIVPDRIPFLVDRGHMEYLHHQSECVSHRHLLNELKWLKTCFYI